jgi:hypothetical protein
MLGVTGVHRRCEGGRDMTKRNRIAVFSFLAVTLEIVVGPAFAQIPEGVSPGAIDRASEIESRCPTFIWNPVQGATFHELVGYRLLEAPDLADPSEVDLSGADQVLYAKVPGSAPAWEPELAECLTPGSNYVWFVRAVYREDTGEVIEASEWSYGRYFSISSVPSVGEVQEALRVLRLYAEQTIDSGEPKTETADTERSGPSRRVAVSQQAAKSVTSAKTAIKGTVSDGSGETYGVVGISNSGAGAGLAAANTGGGADLVLDGSADGDADAVFTQGGIDRRSSSDTGFFLLNSDPVGELSLNVEGTIFGNGSGLSMVDAETFDGLDSTVFATDVEAAALVTAHASSVDHDGRYYTETELGTAGSSALHWENLTNVPVGLDDGDDDTTYTAGPGLVLIGSEFRTLAADSILTPGDNSLSVLDDVGTFEQHLAMTVGSDGLGLMAYFDNSPSRMKIAHCDDPKCTVATLSTISGSGEVDMAGGIVVGSDGLGLVVYHDVTDDLAIEIGQCDDIECSSVSPSVIDGLPGNVWSWPSIALGSDGFGLASYYDGDAGDENLNVAHCNNTACTSATVTVLDTTGKVGWYSSVAIGSDGLGIIAYYDDSNSALKVAHCEDLACSTATISSLDTAGVVGKHTSVTIGSDGLGLISYIDSSNGYLKVAHCQNQACTSAALSILDNSGNNLARTSATIGSDGLGLIAYVDYTAGKLKVAHCSDSLCSDASLVSVAAEGREVSVSTGVDGMPLIGFYQATGPFEGTLSVIHCENVFCVPYFRRR